MADKPPDAFLSYARFDDQNDGGAISCCSSSGGDLVPGTGGVRKLRWALEGRGKRGGARVIYFFHGPDMPLFALTAYAKNVRADLSQADRNAFRRLTKLLAESYRSGTRRGG